MITQEMYAQCNNSGAPSLLFNDIENCKTCGKSLSNMSRVFLSAVRTLSEKFFSQISVVMHQGLQKFMQCPVLLSDFNKIKERKAFRS
jgi:hypothetical protein